jgi:uncharacterized repeat protein (TIGR02543 family)
MRKLNCEIVTAIIICIALTSCKDESNENDPIKFTVTFNSNGGSIIWPQSLKRGEKVAKPFNPALFGHTFFAWYKEVELTNEWKFDIDVVTTDITLHAKWIPNEHTIHFISDKGSHVLQQTVKHGEKATMPDDPILEGYTFVAWYKESKLTNKWNFESDVVTSDLSLYARWYYMDPLFKINGLTIMNYPLVDGSTSTAPLNTLIACKLLDMVYDWRLSLYDGAWGIEPYLKDDAEKLQERVKSSQTNQSFLNLIDNKADLILSARTLS